MSRWRSSIYWMLPLSLAPLLACGPFFPEDALNKPKGILQPPMFHFIAELYKLDHHSLGDASPVTKPGSPAYTLDLEMAEMGEVMRERLPDEVARAAWLASYRELRLSMLRLGDNSDQAFQPEDREKVRLLENTRAQVEPSLSVLPVDIRMYLQGALQYLDSQQGLDQDELKLKKARQIWQELLALPAEQRKWRSTWAAWMLFRTCGPEHSEERGKWLAAARRFSLDGLADCLHLGIEAAYILGRPTSDLPERTQVSDVEWRRAACLRALLGHSRASEQFDRFDRWEYSEWNAEWASQMLADPLLRKVQMLHLIELAQGEFGWEFGRYSEAPSPLKETLEKWLVSFEHAQITGQEEATLLAWLFYNAARFDEARRWLTIAPGDSVVALSLRGKLAALAGQRKDCVEALAKVAKQMPQETDDTRADMEVSSLAEIHPLKQTNYEQVRRHHFLADYGRAQLAVSDFSGALQTFSKTDFWLDTAYIAERLVSVEELLALYRQDKLSEITPTEVVTEDARTLSQLQLKYGGWEPSYGVSGMRYLLVRRLARERYFKDASRLAPKDLARALDGYAKLYRQGHDPKMPRRERAEALWKAAQIHRLLGFEFFGCEGGPDFVMYGGSFDLGSLAQTRQQKIWRPWWERDDEISTEEAIRYRPQFQITGDERWCLRHYGPETDKRFHYRYTAAELAWEAARLMPDNDPKTAEILCVAGGWLKKRDPQAADVFYKALVRRNPTIELAQEADRKRWFPEVEWTFDYDFGL